MALKPRFNGVLGLAALIGLGGLGFELHLAATIARYNQALAAEDYVTAAQLPGARGAFVSAYRAQQAQDYPQARLLYGDLERAPDPALRASSSYNIGNSYLEQALSLDATQDRDRVLPLLELAKGSFRAALSAEPQHWNARYNLEYTLRLAPDFVDQKPPEIEGLRRTLRTLSTADPEGNLP